MFGSHASKRPLSRVSPAQRPVAPTVAPAGTATIEVATITRDEASNADVIDRTAGLRMSYPLGSRTGKH